MITKEQFISFLKTTKRIITPWKKRYESDREYAYYDGWNDCIKEVNKNFKRLLQHLEKIK